MFKLTIMTGHFASEAIGPQKLQKYILRDLYASSLGKKTFLISQGKKWGFCEVLRAFWENQGFVSANSG